MKMRKFLQLTTTWMILTSIMLNKRSQTQKSKYCMMPSIKVKNKQKWSVMLDVRTVVILLGCGQ